ncbi:hypothetical protein KJZ71_02560 [Patescibacteria group bacterium]|uniref:Uncharacterized protein n=1 Tax=candidate division WWE3 bacterium TaxID=2053526 RepID=A0A928TSJ0_UNCKA|nr:hypothetical protein [candidate division WWE3 bacterium]MCL4732668.1 hypothetical protein [Patescibacteria group bacterium]MDL1952678.1 hypothetical protein [Candidatus Uhrbacteria bacterium UHB]RIL01191.1 MAG: hypothetical protein DCC77_01475 [Candidatus Uhrbacteria bacterium]
MKIGKTADLHRSRNSERPSRPVRHDIELQAHIDSEGPPPSNRSVLGNIHMPGLVREPGAPPTTEELEALAAAPPAHAGPLTHQLPLDRALK